MPIKMSSIRNQVKITVHNKTTQSYEGYSSSTTDPNFLFDYSPTACYFAGNFGEIGCYFQFDLRKPYVLYDYSFVQDFNRQPRDFTFEGTNDPKKWSCILDDHDKVQYTRLNKKKSTVESL